MTLEEKVVEKLCNQGLLLGTAESCTGGLLAGRLINVAGASDVFMEGYITYSNEAKERILAVSSETLEEFGAVSYQTAEEMARGVIKKNPRIEVAISTTGVAGPGGGTQEKPVGLIYIAIVLRDTSKVKELHLRGNRQENREETVEQALQLLLSCL